MVVVEVMTKLITAKLCVTPKSVPALISVIHCCFRTVLLNFFFNNFKNLITANSGPAERESGSFRP